MDQPGQGIGMEALAGKTFVRGIVLGGGYCAAFLAMWHVSFDQWYLPAGLRLASLLLLPMRYWPYLFAGDAAALLVLRIPKADQYSMQWAYLSPFLLITSISLIPWLIRKKPNSNRIILDWLPAIALISSIWSTVTGRLINLLLSGPTPTFTIERFISFCIGDFLGILMVTLPCLLWLQRQQWRNTRRHILQSTALATLAVAALYAAAMIPGVQESSVRLMPLVCMLLTVVYLTFLHGWHGSVVGTLLVNVAIALALPRINLVGASDDIVLMAQAVLVVTS